MASSGSTNVSAEERNLITHENNQVCSVENDNLKQVVVDTTSNRKTSGNPAAVFNPNLKNSRTFYLSHDGSSGEEEILAHFMNPVVGSNSFDGIISEHPILRCTKMELPSKMFEPKHYSLVIKPTNGDFKLRVNYPTRHSRRRPQDPTVNINFVLGDEEEEIGTVSFCGGKAIKLRSNCSGKHFKIAAATEPAPSVKLLDAETDQVVVEGTGCNGDIVTETSYTPFNYVVVSGWVKKTTPRISWKKFKGSWHDSQQQQLIEDEFHKLLVLAFFSYWVTDLKEMEEMETSMKSCSETLYRWSHGFRLFFLVFTVISLIWIAVQLSV